MSELDEQIQNRRQKRQALEEAGVACYPPGFDHDLEPHEAQAKYGESTAEELEELALDLRVPGRVRAIRNQGRLAFVDLGDGEAKLQLFIRTKALDEASKTVLENLDLGDYLGARGRLMRTRTGELSLMTEELTMLAKALRPMPEKWHGLTDVEVRYRQRYLDLMSNPESRRVFETRGALVAGIRRFLEERHFLEVETPMMQVIPGGATARPFATHHNALGMDLFLRVAPELYLKRLLVGGLHRVFEINRNFRNEGISTQHNPEFTMLELYWAYVGYEDLMRLTEEMLAHLVTELHGEPALSWHGQRIDLAPPWPRYSMRGAVEELAGVSPERLETVEGVAAELEARGIEAPPGGTYGHLLAALFEETVEDQLLGPVFITHHPVEVSPLAKQCADDSRFTERFELYLGAMEIANAFTELNDPEIQAERFHQQIAARDRGDQEAHLFDRDYIRALEHGMPPAGGEGIGIDRLTMLFTDRPSIRDVILFPLMRPEASEEGSEEGGGES